MSNNRPTILVTGANGQLGSELRALAGSWPQYDFIFTTREELPISDAAALEKFFGAHSFNYCINCAAYTAVDKAETDKENAFAINATAVGHLASLCKKQGTRLIHISTDYVFDGSATQPYKETDATCPVSVYGASKLKGEELALTNDPSTIIIRTSWVYSFFGNNFVKTMLRLMKERESINVVDDQFGCPTYGADLAQAILDMIAKLPTTNNQFSIFNYSNQGKISWFEFAQAIRELTGSKCKVNPIPTSGYPTQAKRPAYSVLDTRRIQETFQISIPYWKDGLVHCLQRLSKH